MYIPVRRTYRSEGGDLLIPRATSHVHRRLLPVLGGLALLLAFAPLDVAGGGGGSGSPRSTGGDAEPNNSIGLAAPLPAGAAFVGALDILADQEDWYVLSVPRGWMLNVSLETADPAVLNPDLELHFEGRDGRWERAWSITDYPFEAMGVLSGASQPYYIRVWARTGGGTYRLDVGIQEPPALTVGTPVTGTLWNDSYRVIDFHRVWLDAGNGTADELSARIDKEGVGGALPWLELRAFRLPEWTPEAALHDVSWGSLVAEDVTVVATVPGWYYLRINAFNGSGTYTLTTSVRRVPVDGDSSPATAAIVYGSSTRLGSLDQARDHDDHVLLPLAAGESFSARLLLDVPVPGVYALTLLDPDGRRLAEYTNYRLGGETGTGPDDLVTSVHLDGTADRTGDYGLVATAKVAVNPAIVADLSEENAATGYRLEIVTAGHNGPPVLARPPGAVAMAEDTPLSVDLSTYFTDPDLADGDVLSFQAIGTPAVSAQVSGSVVTLTPAANWSGHASIEIRALDLARRLSSANLPLVVAQVNDGPTAIAGWPPLTARGSPLVTSPVAPLFADVDLAYGDRLAFSAVLADPTAGTVEVLGDSTLIVTPAAPTVTVLAITASDSAGASATIEVPIALEPAESPPRATVRLPHRVALEEDQPLTLLLGPLAVDPDGGSLSYQLVTDGVFVAGAVIGDALVLHPADNWTGRETLAVRVNDPAGGAVILTILAEVMPSPDTPIIAQALPDGSIGRTARWPVPLRVTVIDADGDPITYWWEIDGRPIPAGTGTPALALEDPGPGPHQVRVTAIDPTGRRAEHRWAVDGGPLPPDPRAATAARTVAIQAGAGLTLLGLLTAIATEPGRFGILKFLILPLYTKIRPEEVLDQFTRGRVYGYIEHHPGANYSAIRRALGLGNGTLTHHLTMLEREGFVVSQADGFLKRFFPRDKAVAKDVLEVSRVQADLLHLVGERPGVSQVDAVRALGVSKRVIHYHVSALVRAGLLRVEKVGRVTKLYAMAKVGKRVRARDGPSNARRGDAQGGSSRTEQPAETPPTPGPADLPAPSRSPFPSPGGVPSAGLPHRPGEPPAEPGQALPPS